MTEKSDEQKKPRLELKKTLHDRQCFVKGEIIYK